MRCQRVRGRLRCTTALAERPKLSTIRLYVADIAEKHPETGWIRLAAHRRIVRGIARTNGASRVPQIRLLRSTTCGRCCWRSATTERPSATAQFVLLGFAAALRRSELVALRVEDPPTPRLIETVVGLRAEADGARQVRRNVWIAPPSAGLWRGRRAKIPVAHPSGWAYFSCMESMVYIPRARRFTIPNTATQRRGA